MSLAISFTVLAATGAGTMAGFFHSFSNVVMGALARIAPAAAIAAMQEINRVVLNPVFFLLFFGTGVTSLVSVTFSLGGGSLQAAMLSAASIVYIVGVLGVTIACNVPLNSALIPVSGDIRGVDIWRSYVLRWTRWNHVRTLASLATLALYLISLALF